MMIYDPNRQGRGVGFLSPSIADAINSTLDIAGSLTKTVTDLAATREAILNPPKVTTTVAPAVMPAAQVAAPVATPAKGPNWIPWVFGGLALVGGVVGYKVLTNKPNRRR
jgi:hypothetical protein